MPYHAHSLVQTKLRGNRICLCHTFVCLAVSLSTGVGELHYAPELAPETVNRSQSSPLGWNFTCPILSDPHLLSAADGQEDAIVVAVPSKPPVADATRYTCAQTRTHAHAHMHTHTHLHTYIYIYTRLHIYKDIHTHVIMHFYHLWIVFIDMRTYLSAPNAYFHRALAGRALRGTSGQLHPTSTAQPPLNVHERW